MMTTVISSAYTTNTLRYDPELCNGCGMCFIVCPHRVFEQDGSEARLARPRSCMECGACARNCPTDAITVEAGVGCAAAMMRAAVLGRGEATCGCGCDTPCCGSS